MEAPELAQILRSCDNYLITFHQNPDADAVGSALGLHFALADLGLKGVVMSPNSLGDFLQSLPGWECILVYDANQAIGNEEIKRAKNIICLDFNDLNRTGLMEGPLKGSTSPKILIDHHLEPKLFAAHMLHDTSAPATALLVYRVLASLPEFTFGVQVATNLYAGIMTDTGSFRFPSTTPETHRVVARLLEMGVNHAEVHEALFDNNTENRLHLLGNCLLNRHEVLPELKTSLMWVTKDDHKSFNIKKGDTEGFVNYNLSIKGMVLAAFLSEEEDMVKLSFRSKGDFPTNLFASKYFQGGGHKNASGGRSFISLEKTIKRFKRKLSEFVQEHPF
ncbi:MAG: bifunctional oligoribonuclease/PAP phosphatase NrnA [Bacteroidetes bacterium]|nr:bifunctional oligoribonuclease/PAP phosphatase NrnA [Bacteroidota bacterium]